jgi:diguanylate cyclase (GGDEF)-like protein
MQDITDRKALEEQVEYRAFHDALTGLANRSLFLDRLDHALDVRQRTGMPIALLYLDVDDFKAVNDTLGHTVGDDLLVQVAGRIRDAVRAGDTVARLGGDEFAVLLEDTDTEGAARAAEAVLHSLLEPLVLHGAHVLVRASVGVVVAQRSMDTEELLRRADIAMYAAKRQGKHAYRVFHETMQSALRTRLGLEAELAEAIEQEQFLLHYQPIVDLTGERLRGVEALIRWDHPRHGVLPPTEFVPLAEETGLITGLGAWVLRTAAKQVAGLQAELGSPISLSINLSPLQLHTDVLAMTRSALTDSGLAPSNLIVEITETSMMSQQDAIRAKLVQLREMGVRVAIDDFGTGYSSLAYLKQLPIDILKIDRAFIRNITGGPEESALAHAIIKLAGLFGLSTVGEGIENAEQAAVLRLLGCGSGQGYYYCRPVEARRLVQEVRSGRLRLPDAAAALPMADKVPPLV